MRTPWRLSHLGGPLNTLLGVHLRRPLLRRRLARVERGLPDDVTVIIAHRNRADYRLANAFESLRSQSYVGGKLKLLVVDYASTPDQLDRLHALAQRFAVECLSLPASSGWNKSHCLNVGIKRTRTRFLMISDVDIVFARNFLAEAVAVLRGDPLAAVYSRAIHLPKGLRDELELAVNTGRRLDPAALKPLGREKTKDDFSPGIVATRTYFFQVIRGYDEFYEGYGAEDSDLAQRFLYLGLHPVSLRERSFYLHQWHPRYEGVDRAAIDAVIARNVAYFQRTHSIQRNPSGWGQTSGGSF